MLIVLVFINAIIFITLSGLHFYWLVGGKWGLALSLPLNPSTQDFLFKPSAFSTLVVALGLLLFALITFFTVFDFPFSLDSRYLRWGDLAISFIFLIRAVGDFRYVGFFKSIRQTSFAKMDSRYYSPLCLVLSIVGILIYYLARTPWRACNGCIGNS